MTAARGGDRSRRGVGAVLAFVLAASLTACSPAVPESVVPGTQVTVGWTGAFTSANAAASPTPGNVAVADTIRAGFGDVVDGEFVADESFGAVTIVGEDPFTVRYDLAEPAWSDGIPLDAADLLLGWAAASGYLDPDGETGATTVEADAEPPVPVIDEFARAVDVTFAQPVIGWQRAVDAPVPAHVVGRIALGVDDAMAAKQAVIRAIQDHDRSALEKIAEVFHSGFEVSGDRTRPELLVSSGPFLIDEIADEAEGQTITLVPNPQFRGSVTPKVARIDLVPPGDQPIAELDTRLDVVILAPTTTDRGPLRELERQDFAVNTSHDGTAWALLLNTAGVFASQPARSAFLRVAPARAMVERGSGLWSSAYTATTSVLSAPGSRAYDIVNEDSGFGVSLGTPAEDPAREREGSGVPDGSAVCVLYDPVSEFAVGAFAALRDAAAEAGWNVVDCSTADFDAALAQRGWDAVIARTPIPRTPDQIAAQWGSGGGDSLTGHADLERDALIAQYAQTTDVYEAREVLAQIEATIVRAAVVLPLAMNPLVTVVDRGVTGVATPDGDAAGLIRGAAQWVSTP